MGCIKGFPNCKRFAISLQRRKNSNKHQSWKIPSEMEAAPRHTLLTLLTGLAPLTWFTLLSMLTWFTLLVGTVDIVYTVYMDYTVDMYTYIYCKGSLQ